MTKKILLSLSLMIPAFLHAQHHIEVINIENPAVQAYIADRTYEHPDVPSDSSIISKYFDTAKYGNYLDCPNGKVLRWTPTAHSFDIKQIDVLLSTHADYSCAMVSHPWSLDATSDTIYNMLPDNIYYYKVIEVQNCGVKHIVACGKFKTVGHLRMICVDGVRNVRDLGGWQTSFGVPVRYGRIYRSGRLDNITPAGIQEYRDNVGVGAELDLRENSKLSASPLGGDVDFAVIGIKQYYEALSTETEQDSLAEDMRWIVKEMKAGRAVDFHCMVGCDRTGTLAFLIEGLLGLSENDISRDYELSTFAADAQGSHACPRNYNGHLGSYVKMIPYIRTFGSEGDDLAQCFYNYWAAIGVSAADLDYVRCEMLGFVPTSIESITDAASPRVGLSAKRVYSVNGTQRNRICKGLNIIVGENGRYEKVMK